MVHLGEKVQFKKKFNTSLFNHPLQIAEMAKAMGAEGIRVEDPKELSKALHRAMGINRPCVIEVMTDQDAIPPLGVRMATLEKFFQSGK